MSDIDAIDSKVGVFLSGGSAVIGIQLAVYALKPDKFTYWPILALLVAVAAFVVLSAASVISMLSRRWAVGPNVLALYDEAERKRYTDPQVKWKAASTYIADYAANEPGYAWKLRGLKVTILCLVVETMAVASGLYALSRG